MPCPARPGGGHNPEDSDTTPARPGERHRSSCRRAIRVRGGRTAELQLGIGGDEGTNDAELELGGPRKDFLLSLVTAPAS